MTYQEIVNRIQSVVDNHFQLADFGYGDLSDLKTRFENTSGDSAVQADYPYLFLNPGTHSRTGSTITYNFNMIVMDMTRGEVDDQPYNNQLAIQSQCQQMIDDVLANLYYGFKDLPEVVRTNISYQPFNERFQDAVSGMTASLSIEVPQGLNDCIAPIQEWELVNTSQLLNQNFDYNFGNMVQWPIPQAIETYKIEWNLLLANASPFTTGGTAPFDVPYLTIWQGTDSPKYFAQEAYDSQTLNAQAIVGDTIISLEDDAPDDNTLFVGLGYDPNQFYPGTSEVPVNIPGACNILTGTVKIYRLV
jgi:hypothetical protein